MSLHYTQLLEYLAQNPKLGIPVLLSCLFLAIIWSPISYIPLALVKSLITPTILRKEPNHLHEENGPAENDRQGRPDLPSNPEVVGLCVALAPHVILLSFGCIIGGLYFLKSLLLMLFRAFTEIFTVGWHISSDDLIAVISPTAIGLFMVISGAFLLSYYRIHFEGAGLSNNFTRNFRVFIAFVATILGSLAAILYAYHYDLVKGTIWAYGLIIFVMFFTLSPIPILSPSSSTDFFSSLWQMFLVLFNIVGLFIVSSPFGLKTGVLPVYILVVYMKKFYPEILLMAREKRNR